MGYGLLMGLGAGLSGLGDTASDWYKNTKAAEAQKSALETEALRRSLLQEQILDNQQMRPLNMKNVQGQIDENAAQTQQAKLNQLLAKLGVLQRDVPGAVTPELRQEASGFGLGAGVFDDEGRVTTDPLTTLKMEGERARIASERAQAGTAGAQAAYYRSRPAADRDDAELRRLTMLGQLAGDDKTNPHAAIILQAAMEKDPVKRQAILAQLTKSMASPAPGVVPAAGGLPDVKF